MPVRVYRLRDRGRRTHRTLAPQEEGRVGLIALHTELRGSESYTAAVLRNGEPKAAPLIPPLHEPVLVALTDRALLLRGFESIDGASYVQEWRCEFC